MGDDHVEDVENVNLQDLHFYSFVGIGLAVLSLIHLNPVCSYIIENCIDLHNINIKILCVKLYFCDKIEFSYSYIAF